MILVAPPTMIVSFSAWAAAEAAARVNATPDTAAIWRKVRMKQSPEVYSPPCADTALSGRMTAIIEIRNLLAAFGAASKSWVLTRKSSVIFGAPPGKPHNVGH